MPSPFPFPCPLPEASLKAFTRLVNPRFREFITGRGRLSLPSEDTPFNPSSAVGKAAVLICRSLCNLGPYFLHYIFDCILNDPALIGQMQTQPLQQFSHHALGSRHGA